MRILVNLEWKNVEFYLFLTDISLLVFPPVFLISLSVQFSEDSMFASKLSFEDGEYCSLSEVRDRLLNISFIAGGLSIRRLFY